MLARFAASKEFIVSDKTSSVLPTFAGSPFKHIAVRRVGSRPEQAAQL
jgi:hypothetical protein